MSDQVQVALIIAAFACSVIGFLLVGEWVCKRVQGRRNDKR